MFIDTCTLTANEVGVRIEDFPVPRAESLKDCVALCNGDEELLVDLVNGAFTIKHQGYWRPQLNKQKVTPEVAMKHAPDWRYTGRRTRRPKPGIEDAIKHFEAEGIENPSLEQLQEWHDEMIAIWEAEQEDDS